VEENNIKPRRVTHTENISTIYANLPTSIPAYVVQNSDMSYTIVLNSRLSRERNIVSYWHEMKHITEKDFEKEDVQQIERDAHKD